MKVYNVVAKSDGVFCESKITTNVVRGVKKYIEEYRRKVYEDITNDFRFNSYELKKLLEENGYNEVQIRIIINSIDDENFID